MYHSHSTHMGGSLHLLCLVLTSTTRFASDVGYKMDKIQTGKIILWTMTWHLIPQQRMKNMIFPHKFWWPFLDCIICIPQLFFRPKYVWFPARLYGRVIPNSSGQLAELIGVYIIPQEWTCIVTKSYWILYFINIKHKGWGLGFIHEG